MRGKSDYSQADQGVSSVTNGPYVDAKIRKHFESTQAISDKPEPEFKLILNELLLLQERVEENKNRTLRVVNSLVPVNAQDPGENLSTPRMPGIVSDLNHMISKIFEQAVLTSEALDRLDRII